jgi:hypothetical protein
MKDTRQSFLQVKALVAAATPVVPLDGVRIKDFESVVSAVIDGPRVFERSAVAVGWYAITAWFGPKCLPHDCTSTGSRKRP